MEEYANSFSIPYAPKPKISVIPHNRIYFPGALHYRNITECLLSAWKVISKLVSFGDLFLTRARNIRIYST